MSTTGKLKHQTARGQRGVGQRGGVSVVVKVGSSETLCRSGISTGEGRGTRRRWGHPGQAAYRWAREMGVQGLQEEL